jgi:hypothetical protein
MNMGSSKNGWRIFAQVIARVASLLTAITGLIVALNSCQPRFPMPSRAPPVEVGRVIHVKALSTDTFSCFCGCAHTATSCPTFSGAWRPEPRLGVSLQLGRFAACKRACGDHSSAFGGGGEVPQVGRAPMERLCGVDWARFHPTCAVRARRDHNSLEISTDEMFCVQADAADPLHYVARGGLPRRASLKAT